MNREKLKRRIMEVRGWDIGEFVETQAKKAIIEPILDNLGWDTSNPREVVLEYPLPPEGRVDYAFLKDHDPIIFVEAKAPRKPLDKHATQLLRYSFAKGVGLAVLTNGVEWWLFLPMEGGEWNDRKFYSIDLEKQDIDEVCDRLIEFLGKDNVFSGEAIRNATEMRKSREGPMKIQQTLPEAWNTLITKPDGILVDLLIDETERACGFKPDESTVKSFIAKIPPIPSSPSTGHSPPPSTGGQGSGLLIYAPVINPETFLHFSWKGESCTLRDYSQSPTIRPTKDSRHTTSYVRARITNQVQVEKRNRLHIDYWHKKTLEANRSINRTDINRPSQ